jgi:hypothetical protein
MRLRNCCLLHLGKKQIINDCGFVLLIDLAPIDFICSKWTSGQAKVDMICRVYC